MNSSVATDLEAKSERTRTFWPRGYLLVVLLALAAALALSITGAIVGTQSGPDRIFWFEIGFDISPAWLCVFSVCVAPVGALFFNRRAKNPPGASRPFRTDWRVLVLLVAGSTLFYAALMNWGAHRIAYTPDEAAVVLQAQTFAAGHIAPHVQPELAALVVPKWTQNGIFAVSPTTGFYWTTYWPGYALLMAPLAFFGLEWWLNPLLSALSLALTWMLARRLTHSDEASWWAVVIMLASTQIALSAASYYSMPAHLLFNLLFCLLLVRNTKRSSFVAGLVGGFALILHNPAPHFSFALPWLVWMLRYRRTHLLPLLSGYTLVFVPLFFGWLVHLRDMGTPASQGATAPSSSSFVSKVEQILRPPTTQLLLARLAGLGKLVVWSVPGAAGIAFLGWLEARRARQQVLAPRQVQDFDAHYLWLLGISLLSSFVVYMAVRFDQGHGWGFRYLHQSWLVIPVLGGAFLARQSGTWKSTAKILVASGLLLVLPLRLLQMEEMMAFSERDRPPAPPSSPAITFVQEKGQTVLWIKNDPFLRDPRWNLRFVSPQQNALLAKRYLRGAKRVQSGAWGETWVGDAFAHPGSPSK